MTSASGDVGLLPQAVFVNGHWVVVGKAKDGGQGGIWTLKEDSSPGSCGASACTIDACALIRSYAAANGFARPECPTGGSGNSGITLNNQSLIKISDTDFMLLANRYLKTPDHPPAGYETDCQKNAHVLRFKTQLYSGRLALSLVSHVMGCYSNMFVLNNKLILVGKRATQSPFEMHEFTTANLAYVQSHPLLHQNQSVGSAFCSTDHSFFTSWLAASQLYSKIGRYTAGGLSFEYINFNPLEYSCYSGDYLERSHLMTVQKGSTYNIRTTRLYKETSPGILVEQKRITLDTNGLGGGTHFTRLNNAERVLNIGRYIQVGERPYVYLPATGTDSTSIPKEVYISPNGYILSLQTKDIYISRMILN